MCSSSHQKEASVSRNRTWRVVVFDKEYSCARHVHFWRGGTSNAEVRQLFKTWMASSLLIFFPRLNFFRQISVARIVIFSFLFFFSKNICGLLSQHLAGVMTLLCDLFLRTAIYQYFNMSSPYCHYCIYSSLIENLYKHAAAFCSQHTITKIEKLKQKNMILRPQCHLWSNYDGYCNTLMNIFKH